MNNTLKQLKYRIENNKYFTADHVRAVILEAGELNEEDQTVAHLLEVAETSGWLGKVDGDGFYPSLIFTATEPQRLGADRENRFWLLTAVPATKVRR